MQNIAIFLKDQKTKCIIKMETLKDKCWYIT